MSHLEALKDADLPVSESAAGVHCTPITSHGDPANELSQTDRSLAESRKQVTSKPKKKLRASSPLAVALRRRPYDRGGSRRAPRNLNRR